MRKTSDGAPDTPAYFPHIYNRPVDPYRIRHYSLAVMRHQKTAWGYLRFSTDHQGPLSVERQVEAIERWAGRFGFTLLGYSWDYELSRTLDHGDRPGLCWALATVPALGIGVLVAESVSRLAGDAYILGAIRRQLPKGSRLATSDETGDADLDEDRQDFEAMFSKREIKQIRQRTKGALGVKKMRGEVVGCVPFGFRRKPDGQHVQTREHVRKCVLQDPDCGGCLHLEPDPSEQAIIARARELYQVSHNASLVMRQLEQEKFLSRAGKPLAYPQVYRLLFPVMVLVLGLLGCGGAAGSVLQDPPSDAAIEHSSTEGGPLDSAPDHQGAPPPDATIEHSSPEDAAKDVGIPDSPPEASGPYAWDGGVPPVGWAPDAGSYTPVCPPCVVDPATTGLGFMPPFKACVTIGTKYLLVCPVGCIPDMPSGMQPGSFEGTGTDPLLTPPERWFWCSN